jgi:hypothetical protein
MGSRKEIMLLVVYQDGYTYKTVRIPCTAQENLFTEITRHCQFAEWDRVSARIGRSEMCVCNEYNTPDETSAKNLLQHVLNAFFETEALPCNITVITKNRPAPMSRL